MSRNAAATAVVPVTDLRAEEQPAQERAASRSSSYRADIDGLRAVAVVSVLVYHAFPTGLPGGFVGVDLFFVISGFVITRLILSDLRAGTFSVGRFYERRVRRLVPALLLLLAASAAFGWFALTPVEFRWLGKNLAWDAAFLGNALLSMGSRYFEDIAYQSPLLHLWSLGVEEQFYLIWPVLLLLATKYDVLRRTLGAVIGASLAISVWGAMSSPDVHFYRLSSRAWELGAGAMLAASWPGRTAALRGRAFLSAGLSFCGAALLAAAALLLDGNDLFPGAWALIPTLGSVAIIAAGPDAGLNRLLTAAPLVFVGRISYSLYLWHWPLLAFPHIVLGRPLPPLAAIGALVVAFAAACVSYYFVERPVRFGLPGSRTLAVLLAGLALSSAVGLAIAWKGIPARLSLPSIERFDAAGTDWTYPGTFRMGWRPDFKPLLIRSRRAQTAVFIGDSHVAQYWSRAAALIREHPDSARSAEFIAYGGCPPLPGVNAVRAGAACNRFLDYALSETLRPGVDTVVFGAFWEIYLLGEASPEHKRAPIYRLGDPTRTPLVLGSPGAQQALEDFAALTKKLAASGYRVVILLSNPTSPLFVPSTMIPPAVRLAWQTPQSPTLDLWTRSVDARPYEAYVAPLMRDLRSIADQAGAEVIDPAEALCDHLICPATSPKGEPLYKDSNHLRPFFARDRATFIDTVLMDDPPRAGGTP